MDSLCEQAGHGGAAPGASDHFGSDQIARRFLQFEKADNGKRELGHNIERAHNLRPRIQYVHRHASRDCLGLVAMEKAHPTSKYIFDSLPDWFHICDRIRPSCGLQYCVRNSFQISVL